MESRSRNILVEVCAASVDDVLAAERAGADRVELNSGVALGGLTPSPGMLKTALALSGLPLIAMCRPRAAGFCYSENELRTLREDIGYCLAAGARGVAFGVLTADGGIDTRWCRQLVEDCAGCESVFHRAIDLTSDLGASVQQLIDCGVTRVMTSGGRATAPEGRETLAQLVDRFGDHITVMAAGGIRPENLSSVLETGVTEVHAGPGRWARDPSWPDQGGIRFDRPPRENPAEYQVVCEQSVRELVQPGTTRGTASRLR